MRAYLRVNTTFSFLKVTFSDVKEPFRLVKGSFTKVPMAGTITNTQPTKQFVHNARPRVGNLLGG